MRLTKLLPPVSFILNPYHNPNPTLIILKLNPNQNLIFSGDQFCLINPDIFGGGAILYLNATKFRPRATKCGLILAGNCLNLLVHDRISGSSRDKPAQKIIP